MAVRPAHRHRVYMTQLLGHRHQGRSGLHQLAGIGVPKAVKGELLRQSCGPDGGLNRLTPRIARLNSLALTAWRARATVV